MTTAAIIFLFGAICFLVFALCLLNNSFPSAAQEAEQAQKDLDAMMARANEELTKRPHVRAGKAV